MVAERETEKFEFTDQEMKDEEKKKSAENERRLAKESAAVASQMKDDLDDDGRPVDKRGETELGILSKEEMMRRANEFASANY